jgi:dipeptidyl aminopeptidase/acylaminoacyl peptidase
MPPLEILVSFAQFHWILPKTISQTNGEATMMRIPLLVAFSIILGATPASLAQSQFSTPSPQTKQLTPESFLELRNVLDPQFSADGSRIAFVVSDPLKGEKRTQHIWLYDIPGDRLRQFTFSQKSETFPRWSPDGKKLAFLSNRGDEQQLYVLSMAAGEASLLTKAKAAVSAFSWSPDGQTIAYLSPDPKSEAEEKKEKDKDDARVVDKDDKHPQLRVISVSTQETRSLTEATWEVKEAEWLPDGQSLAVKATDRPAIEHFTDRLYLISVKEAKKQEILAPRGPFGRIRVSPSGTTIAFVGSRDDGPQGHDLWLLPTAGGTPSNLSSTNLDRPISSYYFAKGGWIVAHYADGFRTKLAGYQEDGTKREMTGTLPVNPAGFSVSPTGEIAFVGQTTTSMQELWLRDTTGAARQLTHFNDSWKSYNLVAPEFYKYKSSDLEIEAALLKPANYDGRSKLPTVILVHGGPTGNWSDTVEAWGQLLVARGFAVVYPNVRGSTGYGHKFLESNRADWGGGDFKDVMAAVDDIIAKGIADPDRLGIGGWSYGGYMAEWAITQTTRFKAAVTGAGMSNLISEFGTEKDPAYDEWFWSSPYEKPEGFLNASPFLYVKQAKTPTLILQGEADTSDPPGQSLELYRGLKHYGVPTELVLYPREPHGFQEAKHRVDMQKRVVDWFTEYLQPSK